MAVYLFKHDAQDFSTNGLVGDLQPLECRFEEQKNGISQITMLIPYDKLEKWKQVQVGRYIKADVPVRTPPVMGDNAYAQMANIYKIIDDQG